MCSFVFFSLLSHSFLHTLALSHSFSFSFFSPMLLSHLCVYCQHHIRWEQNRTRIHLLGQPFECELKLNYEHCVIYTTHTYVLQSHAWTCCHVQNTFSLSLPPSLIGFLTSARTRTHTIASNTQKHDRVCFVCVRFLGNEFECDRISRNKTIWSFMQFGIIKIPHSFCPIAWICESKHSQNWQNIHRRFEYQLFDILFKQIPSETNPEKK